MKPITQFRRRVKALEQEVARMTKLYVQDCNTFTYELTLLRRENNDLRKINEMLRLPAKKKRKE